MAKGLHFRLASGLLVFLTCCLLKCFDSGLLYLFPIQARPATAVAPEHARVLLGRGHDPYESCAFGLQRHN